MKAFGLLVVVVLALVLDGCASSTPPERSDTSVRTRCLNDRREGSTRPIIFLFCVESP